MATGGVKTPPLIALAFAQHLSLSLFLFAFYPVVCRVHRHHRDRLHCELPVHYRCSGLGRVVAHLVREIPSLRRQCVPPFHHHSDEDSPAPKVTDAQQDRAPQLQRFLIATCPLWGREATTLATRCLASCNPPFHAFAVKRRTSSHSASAAS